MGRCLALSPPFTAEGRALCLHVSAVDGCACRDDSGSSQRLEHPRPKPLPGPAIESVVDGGVRTILIRAIDPTASRLEDMDDAGDHPPIINSPRPRLVLRHEGPNRRPLLIAQPKQPAHVSLHRNFDLAKHDLPSTINGLIEFGA